MTNELKNGKRMKKNKYIRMSVVIMMGIMCVSGMPSNAYAIENNAEISERKCAKSIIRRNGLE